MTTQYGLTRNAERAENRRKIMEFDGVEIVSLPRMVEDTETGDVVAAWTRLTPFGHGDDSTVKMETHGGRFGATTRWNPETRQREPIPGAPRWEGHIVIYATARWETGDVVKVSLWESEVRGEVREWWRLEWTASPVIGDRRMFWVEDAADAARWADMAGDSDTYPLWRAVTGGPSDARRRGALVVAEYDAPDPAERVFDPSSEPDWPENPEE